MFKKTCLNKKGFTLVELLAVIVVLAIIMIIAIPSVMDSMNSARKGAFKIYVQKALGQAQTKYQSDLLLNDTTYKTVAISNAATRGVETTGYCYTLDILGLRTGGASKYSGYVIVTKDSSGSKNYFYATMKDDNYNVANQSYTTLETASNIGGYLSTALNCPTSYSSPAKS